MNKSQESTSVAMVSETRKKGRQGENGVEFGKGEAEVVTLGGVAAAAKEEVGDRLRLSTCCAHGRVNGLDPVEVGVEPDVAGAELCDERVGATREAVVYTDNTGAWRGWVVGFETLEPV